METLRFLMVSTHFSPYSFGGDAVLVDYLAKELVKSGHEVHVFHSPNAYRLVRKVPPTASNEAAIDGVARHPHGSPLGRVEPVLALTTGCSVKAMQRLRALTKDLRPDVVHWHNTRGFIGRPEALPGVASLYTAHDYYLVCPRSNLLRPGTAVCNRPELCQLCVLRWRKPPQLWRAGRWRVIRLPSGFKVISPSEFLASRLGQDKITVDTVLRNFVPKPREMDRERRTGQNLILFLGLLEPHKGPHALLEGFALCRDKQGFKLMIVGEGSLKSWLRNRVNELRLGDRVEVPGYLPKPDLERVLNQAASLAIPSLWFENSPLVVLEAFSKGIPVMGSNLGGLPELLTPESGSLTFRSVDPEGIAQSIVETWNGRHRLEERSRMARDAYEKLFSPEHYLTKYLSFIKMT